MIMCVLRHTTGAYLTSYGERTPKLEGAYRVPICIARFLIPENGWNWVEVTVGVSVARISKGLPSLPPPSEEAYLAFDDGVPIAYTWEKETSRRAMGLKDLLLPMLDPKTKIPQQIDVGPSFFITKEEFLALRANGAKGE